MIDVLFIPAPIRFPQKNQISQFGDETSIPPLGLMYIASFLNSRGYHCRILETGLRGLSLSQIIQQIRKINPRVVGISVLTASTITAVPLAREIKKRFPKIIVGCGGTHICVDPTFIKRYPYFDFAVKGEGELIMLKLMKKIDRGEKVSGLYDGGYIKDLDSLPFPDYSLIHFKEYGYPFDKVGKRSTAVSLMASRGCPFNCIFCTKSESRVFVRFRSPENIVAEIEKNYPFSKRFYQFVDDTMSLNRPNVRRMCELLIKKKLKISWIAMTRADCLDLKLAKLMSRAGCMDLLIGVESGDSRIRNVVVKKMVRDKDIFRAIKICRQVGIRTSLFLMLGFPTEGKKEMEKTVNCGLLYKADLIGIHITSPIPGSELYDEAIKKGMIPADLVDQYITGKIGKDYSCWPKYIPEGLSLDYLEKARTRAMRKFYLSPQFVFRLLRYYLRFPSRIKYDKHLFKNGLSMLLKGRSKVQFS